MNFSTLFLQQALIDTPCSWSLRWHTLDLLHFVHQALADFLALLQHFGTYGRLWSQCEALLRRCGWPVVALALMIWKRNFMALPMIENFTIGWWLPLWSPRRWRKLRIRFRFRHLSLVIGEKTFGRIGSHILGSESLAATSSQRQLVGVFSKLRLCLSERLCFRIWHGLLWFIVRLTLQLCFKICLLYYTLHDGSSDMLRWWISWNDLMPRWREVTLQRIQIFLKLDLIFLNFFFVVLLRLLQ